MVAMAACRCGSCSTLRGAHYISCPAHCPKSTVYGECRDSAAAGRGTWANLTQPVAISPDGAFLALIAMRNGHTELWLRRLDASEAQPIAGSQDAASPFWSPDSRYLGFFASGKLKKVDVSGGKVSDICATGRFPMGGASFSRGVIVFSILDDALKRVSDNGGIPEPISGISLRSDSAGQDWPVSSRWKALPFLGWRYPVFGSHDNVVWIGSLDGEKARSLPLASTSVQHSAGYLLFSQDGDLFAQDSTWRKTNCRDPRFPSHEAFNSTPFFKMRPSPFLTTVSWCTGPGEPVLTPN